MVVDPTKLIAAISPDVYCNKKTKGEVKKIVASEIREVKEKIAQKKREGRAVIAEDYQTEAYLKAAEKVELVESDFMDLGAVVSTPLQLLGIKNPIERHAIEYETSSQALEQVYFWLHDHIQGGGDYGTVEKVVDNFVSSPGSAHFSETGAKATKMQEEGMKMLGIANQLIKTILNIIYDLKEFKLRLDIYNDYEDKKDRNKSNAAYLSLKQIWLDQVDIKRGNSSIKGLAVSGANAPNFVMLIDAFMVVKSLEGIKKLDLNERIKRIVEQRFSEFERWLKESGKELRKRFEIEKTYLKSQLNTVKLYAKWAKPYLRAAAQLEQRATATSALVSTFNTSISELVLLGIGKYDPMGDVNRGDLPKSFVGKNNREYAPVVLVELKFRGIPERFQQGGYGFRGKAEVVFTSFALNKEERRILKEQIEWDDFRDVYSLIAGATDESLGQLQTDINDILGESVKKSARQETGSEETNPFSALFSIVTDLFKKSEIKEKKETKEKVLDVKPDSSFEQVIRSQACIEARRKCRKFYDSFKRSNNSPAF